MAIRLKTVEYALEQNTATVASTVTRTFATRTIHIPEITSRSFKSVILVLGVQDTPGPNSVSNVTMGVQLAAVAVEDVTVLSGTNNSGEAIGYVWTRDCTSYFEANFGAGTSQTFIATLTVTGTSTNNASAKLVITYEFDDAAAATLLKTVRIPIEANTAALTIAFTPVGGSVDNIPDLSTFLPETGKVYRSIQIETWVNENRNSASAAVILSYRHDGVTSIDDAAHTHTLASSRNILRIDDITATLNTGAVSTLEAKVDSQSATFDCIAPVIVVTYEYDASSTRVINSLLVPMTNPMFVHGTTTDDKERLVGDLWIQEPGTITLVQSGFLFATNFNASTTFDCRAGAQPSRTFVFISGSSVTCGGAEWGRRVDSGAAGGAGITVARGFNEFSVDLFVHLALDVTGMSAVLVLNYTSDVATDGPESHNKSIVHRQAMYDPAVTRKTLTAASAITPAIPEADYWISNVMLQQMMSWGGIAQIDTWEHVTAEIQSGESVGAGWVPVANFTQFGDGEVGYFLQWAKCTDIWHRTANELDSKRISLQAQRDWHYSAYPLGFTQSWLVYNYHSISLIKNGQVDGYVGDGSGIPVKVFMADSNEYVATATTIAGGSFSFTWFDDTLDMFATAVEDATHLGRSVDTTGDLDISFGSGAVVPDPAPSISNLDPGEGAELDEDTILSFDVTCDAGTFVLLQLLVYYDDGTSVVVFKDGVFKDFLFVGAPNVATPIVGGFNFTLRPIGGWQQKPYLDIEVIDAFATKGVLV